MFGKSVVVVLSALASAPSEPTIIFPTEASPVDGEIELVMLSPLFRESFACVEHPLGQLTFTGDALGTDCTIMGGISREGGFVRPFRSDGSTNEDWYGWHAPVLAPFDGEVVGVLAKSEVNTPGNFGKPPAAMLQFRSAEGVIVTYAHVTAIQVKVGDKVSAGQQVAQVGNNGFSRAPHIHVGAWREEGNTPLQIRWDLRAMARLRAN